MHIVLFALSLRTSLFFCNNNVSLCHCPSLCLSVSLYIYVSLWFWFCLSLVLVLSLSVSVCLSLSSLSISLSLSLYPVTYWNLPQPTDIISEVCLDAIMQHKLKAIILNVFVAGLYKPLYKTDHKEDVARTILSRANSKMIVAFNSYPVNNS